MSNKEIEQMALELSEIERVLLRTLKEKIKYSESELQEKTKLNRDSLRRAIQMLKEKGLIETFEDKKHDYALTELGERSSGGQLPEEKLMRLLKENGESISLKDAAKKALLSSSELSSAIGELKVLNFVQIQSGFISLTEVGKEFGKVKLPTAKILANEDGADTELKQALIKRGLIKYTERIFVTVSITPSGLDIKEELETIGTKREFNLNAPVQPLYLGKAQPYNQFLKSIRKKLINLGFTEMKERLIVQEFYNFDVLFQPQNHPARQWTDSYQLKQPTHGKLPDKKIVNKIKAAHEHGGISGSSGWGYTWSEEIASKVMPTAHGTAMDAKQWCEGFDNPKKYFVINRCFRPDVLDAKHLVEFNQLDGFIVGRGLNFRNLLFTLKQFAQEVAGVNEVRFGTSYYPFTEPSCELSIKHPKLGWMEVAGAGLARPEISASFGIKEPMLMWGMGIDRLAMVKLGITDIRYLFADDLQWLRNAKMVID